MFTENRVEMMVKVKHSASLRLGEWTAQAWRQWFHGDPWVLAVRS